MKCSKSETHRKTHSVPELRFEDQELTSFSGLVIVQPLLVKMELKKKLRACFRYQSCSSIYGLHSITLLLMLHILLGYRKLSDISCYQKDPIVRHISGLRHLPNASTISRHLNLVEDNSVRNLRHLATQEVSNRLKIIKPKRVTLDFDGSVISTSRHVEGTAVGYNKVKKGQRSYYPLFCTIAQTGQVFDVLHRPGNVHDSNGAKNFISDCVEKIRVILPKAAIEVRMDSAFFSDELVKQLDQLKIEFTISVPFERFAELKGKIESCEKWNNIDRACDYFEESWKPKKWNQQHRFIFIRQQVFKQQKGVVQLDLFRPYEKGFDFKVIITNKSVAVDEIVSYHNGRGSQEGIFAELKSNAQMDYIPVQTRTGNQLYLLTTIMAHNLNRELQMQAKPVERQNSPKRTQFWKFASLESLRKRIFLNAGRIIRPQGRMILSMNANESVKAEIETYRLLTN